MSRVNEALTLEPFCLLYHKKVKYMKEIQLIVACVLPILIISAVINQSSSAKEDSQTGLFTIEVPCALPSDVKPEMVPVDVFIPKSKVRADLLVLPGWKYSRVRWHKETKLLEYCENAGYRAVFPDMKNSVYESAYFPETTMKWGKMPGGAWVRDALTPALRKNYGIFEKKNKNFVLGLSTGGRGVLIVNMLNPGLFSAGATLSGDFDQTLMPTDRLMAMVYGDYNSLALRWKQVDNPITEMNKKKWKMPLYIGHGKKDTVVPFAQSNLLYETMKKLYPNLKSEFSAPENAGHDFAFWGSELEGVFKFFKSLE